VIITDFAESAVSSQAKKDNALWWKPGISGGSAPHHLFGSILRKYRDVAFCEESPKDYHEKRFTAISLGAEKMGTAALR
jgi:hypothetical protein